MLALGQSSIITPISLPATPLKQYQTPQTKRHDCKNRRRLEQAKWSIWMSPNQGWRDKVYEGFTSPQSPWGKKTHLACITTVIKFTTHIFIPQIGRVTERWLEVLDVKTCGDIWEQRAKLLLMRSEVNFDLLLNVSRFHSYDSLQKGVFLQHFSRGWIGLLGIRCNRYQA